MTGYTKLFGSIVASTIWRESNHTRIVWITMLAMANRDGIVEASIPGLADMARVTIDELEKSLEILQSTDKYSRTKEHEGRRIKTADDGSGWLILNHAKYRSKMNSDDRREYLKNKQREHRAKVKALKANTPPQATPPPDAVNNSVNKDKPESTGSTQAEAKAEAQSDSKGQNGARALEPKPEQRGAEPERQRQAIGQPQPPVSPPNAQQAPGATQSSQGDANNDPADDDNVFAHAVSAFDQWSSTGHPTGRGRPLQPAQNELQHVRRLIDRVAQLPAIPRGNNLINRVLLIGLAADSLRAEGVTFKAPSFAAQCIYNRLDEWAGVGVPQPGAPTAEPRAPRKSFDQQDRDDRAASVARARKMLEEEYEQEARQ